MKRSVYAFGLLPLLLSPTLALAQVGDEPGVGVPPPQTQPVTDIDSAGQRDLVGLARAECQPGKPCRHFSSLVRALFTGREAGVAGMLATLGDPRAVVPLALAAAYGQTPKAAGAAAAGLRQLVSRPSARDVAVRVGKTNPDPAVRRAVAIALGGEAELDREQVQTEADAGETGGPKKRLTDPETTRLVYGPTAFGRTKGTWSWTIYNIAYWNFDYGISDNVEIGLQTVPPIGVLAFMPHMKLTMKVSEKVSLGARVFGGIVYPYVENTDGFLAAVYGGAPVLTIGDTDLLFNASVMINGVTVREGSQGDTFNGWTVIPNVGFSWRFARRIKFNAELYVPLLEDNPLGNGELWVLLYGLRFFGRSIYGDVSFALPFWDGMGDVMKYVPMGFPLLTFGFQW